MNYRDLLAQAGIPEQAMAQHLASMGLGTPQQWQQAIATGNVSMFNHADAENAKAFIRNNPQLVQQVRQVVGM